VELQGGLARPIKQGLGGPAQSAKCSVDALLQRQFAFVVNALVFRGVEDQSKEMKVKGVQEFARKGEPDRSRGDEGLDDKPERDCGCDPSSQPRRYYFSE
jgi:hypothetical protein